MNQNGATHSSIVTIVVYIIVYNYIGVSCTHASIVNYGSLYLGYVHASIVNIEVYIFD